MRDQSSFLVGTAMRSLLLALPVSLVLLQSAEARCKSMRAESDLLGIRLVDEGSTEQVLKSWALPEVKALASEQDKTPDGADADFPFLRLISAGRRQQAKLFHHYGSVLGAFPELEVWPAEPDRATGTRVPIAAFSTEHGLKLGLPEDEVIRKLGTCFRRERDAAGDTALLFEITDPSHPLLRRAGCPSYFARYAFRKGRLRWFRFGFDAI
jgi:hypothetical protein